MRHQIGRTVLVVAIAMTACSDSGKPSPKAASSTTTTATGLAGPSGNEPGRPSPSPGAAGQAGAATPEGAQRAPSVTPHSRGDTSTQPGEFVFLVTTNDPGRTQPSTWWYDVVTKSTGETIDATWTLRYGNPPERRKLRKSGDALVGLHLPGQAGEYHDCDWKPTPVHVPRLEVGATATIDSTCEHSESPPPDHHHLTGSVKVTGTRDVRFNGQTLTVWIVEREWRHVVAEDRNDEIMVRSVGWWSPDLSMIVRSEAVLDQPPDLPQPVHLGMSSKLLGLEE